MSTERPLLTFAKGLVGGIGGGVLTVALPPVGVVMLVAGAVVAGRAIVTEPSKRTEVLVLSAGFLLGLGALLLYGSWNVISACQDTTDFCGNANVVPLLVAGIAAVAAGFLAAIGSIRAARRR